MRSACVVFFAACAVPAVAAPCPAPKPMVFHVESQLHRDAIGFTEGLEVHQGRLYESTGDYFGDTRINRIDLETGKVTALLNAGKDYFGEGLTFFHDRLYQMTWREHQVFVFNDAHLGDLKAYKPLELNNPREGWGLTHDDSRLIASDGSDKLFFLSPRDFSTEGTVTVMRGAKPVFNLNELEYVDGAVYANVYETWQLLRISPATGCVLGEADMKGLHEQMSPTDQRKVDFDGNFVLNGIAHDPATGRFILTGKYWPMLFLGRFEDQ